MNHHAAVELLLLDGGAGGSPPALPKQFLFLLASQSNGGTDPATGRVPYANIPANLIPLMPNVNYWAYGGGSFGSFTQSPANEWGFLNEFMRAKPLDFGNAIYVAKHGLGGTRLSSDGTGIFYPLNETLVMWRDVVTAFLALPAVTNPVIVLLDSHGTTDGIDLDNSQAYFYTLRELFETARNFLKIPNLYCIYERLSTSCTSPFTNNIRTAKQNDTTLDSGFIMLDSDSWPYQGDGAHYNAAGAVAGGQAYSAAAPATLNSTIGSTFDPSQLLPVAFWDVRKINPANTFNETTFSSPDTFVAKINDFSGWGHRLRNLTTAQQPQLINGGLANARVLCNRQRLLGTGAWEMDSFCQSSFDMFFYLDQASATPGTQSMITEALKVGDRFSIYVEGVAPYKIVCRMVNNVSLFTKSLNGVGNTNKFLLGVRLDYTNAIVRISLGGVDVTLDGAFPGALGTFAAAGWLPGLMNLLQRNPFTTNEGWDGNFYGGLIVPRILSAPERANVVAYFSY